jgi:hypothetical protein
VIDLPLHELEAGMADLRARCGEIGRNPDEVVVSMRAQIRITQAPVPEAERFAPLIGPLPDVVRDLRRMEEIGVGEVALWPVGQGLDLAAYLARMEELARDVLPALAGRTGNPA